MPGFTQIPNDEVFDNPLWIADQFTRGQAFIDLYRLAQFKKGFIIKRGIPIYLKPGQVGWSMVNLGKRWQWSIGKVRRYLNTLEIAGQIELQKTNVSTTITILHWINNDTPNRHADGTQTVLQTESKRYPNNIVNKGNRDNRKPLIKHCPEGHSTKEADRDKPWDCFCVECGVQMVDKFELVLK